MYSHGMKRFLPKFVGSNDLTVYDSARDPHAVFSIVPTYLKYSLLFNKQSALHARGPLASLTKRNPFLNDRDSER